MGMAAFFTSLSFDDVELLETYPDAVTSCLEDDGEGERIATDVDKAWHGIHYMLTEGDDDSRSPVSNAVLGGRPVGEDLGYGPARILEPAEVKAIADALEGLPLNKFP